MIRILLLRILVVCLFGYIIYLLHKRAVLKAEERVRRHIIDTLETTEYDKHEWEKIKKELEKK